MATQNPAPNIPASSKPKRRWLRIAGIIVLLVVLAGGAFFAYTSYMLGQLASMTFDEMLAFTTEDNADALVTVGIISNGETSITLYGADAAILPNPQPEALEYEIGSVTKTFTTALLARAVAEGKVALSDSIDHYLDLPPKAYYPTLQRLVTHTAGYEANYLYGQMVTNFFNREENDLYGISPEALANKLAQVSLEDKEYPFLYSNFGMSVAGRVLEEVYGADYKTIMDEFVATDLRLQNTYISDGTGNMAGYWRWDADDAFLPAGALISTISDMLDYVELYLAEQPPYLGMWRANIAAVDVNSRQLAQTGMRIDAAGMGWMIDTENGIAWHNGGTSNFNSYVAFDTERQIGVVILANLPSGYRIPATVMGPELMKTLQVHGLQ